MTLTAGARLGPYTILAPLGAGGMGEVYRARDERLSRDVAIKVLPAELASDVERLKRFEKEARSASSLNHPNIVTIYDIGTSEGVSYIAMERVEGATLRELLAGGPLPVRKLLPIATQITEGLAKAHEAGIVHRDLKPENVMVTRDGLVKILDFGLAKLTSKMSGSGEGSQLPTMTGTSPGVVVGTVGYMSPEQASAGPLDYRSDQFAFGSILYEMATGKRAFQKKTAIDTLSAILNEEPEPIAGINPQVPAPLRWIVERCHVKEPEGRFISTGDMARDLALLRDHLSEAAVSGSGIEPRRRRRRLLWGGVAAATFLVALGVALWTGGRLRQFDPPSFERLTFRRGSHDWARFAPDGQTIVYGATWEGEPARLYTTRVGSPESRLLDLPAGATLLAISSTAELAINLHDTGGAPGEGMGTLARVPLAGGAPREVLEDVYGADFSPDGKELAVVRRAGSKRRLECPIGKVLYEGDRIWSPRFSPKGDQVAFLEDLPGRRRLCLVDLRGKMRVLRDEVAGAFMVAWSPKGDEIWYSARAFRAVSMSGRERVLLRFPEPSWVHLNDTTRDGRVLAVIADYRVGLIALPPGATREKEISWQGYSGLSDLTPDGKTVLFDDNGGSYLRGTDGGSPAVKVGENCFALSNDGKNVACYSDEAPGAIVVTPTGAGESKVLKAQGIEFGGGGGWFPDGARLLVWGREPGRPRRAYVVPLDGSAQRAVTPEGVVDLGMSPDGRLVAATDSEGKLTLYPIEGGEPRHPPGGPDPGEIVLWSSDGKWLLEAEQGRVFRRDLETGERRLWKELVPSDPAGIFGIHPVFAQDGKSYAYSYARWISNLYLVKGLK